MRVAQLRGAKFVVSRWGVKKPWRIPQDESDRQTFVIALQDVAHTLGYEDAWEYNRACVVDTARVQERIRDL